MKLFVGKLRSLSNRCGEAGQATAEYALVLLGAASVALLLLKWAGGTGAIGSLLDFIVSKITSSVG